LGTRHAHGDGTRGGAARPVPVAAGSVRSRIRSRPGGPVKVHGSRRDRRIRSGGSGEQHLSVGADATPGGSPLGTRRSGRALGGAAEDHGRIGRRARWGLPRTRAPPPLCFGALSCRSYFGSGRSSRSSCQYDQRGSSSCRPPPPTNQPCQIFFPGWGMSSSWSPLHSPGRHQFHPSEEKATTGRPAEPRCPDC
jgi:hypothetical protein